MTRVLIIDDSRVVCDVLEAALALQPDIEVVGTAADAYAARDLIVQLRPDVVTLDLQMPGMDGITFLRKLMHYHPVPVVVVSSHTHHDGALTMAALALGAIDVVGKPTAGRSLADIVPDLAHRLRIAARVDMTGQLAQAPATPTSPRPASLSRSSGRTSQILAIGASTGGTAALESILTGMPHDLPGTVVVQHMPALFTAAFASRLAMITGLNVTEARNGDAVEQGAVLVSPGDVHTVLRRDGARYFVELRSGPRVSGHRPSVDVMFRSVARAAGKNAIGVILTGMGKDGSKGLLHMKQAGAATVAQDEASCTVYGMPRAAVEAGAVDHVVSLANIPKHIIKLVDMGTKHRPTTSRKK
jgi:two-component system, chemotaxis family, protein-glutamate methylesterase/glutaminase